MPRAGAGTLGAAAPVTGAGAQGWAFASAAPIPATAERLGRGPFVPAVWVLWPLGKSRRAGYAWSGGVVGVQEARNAQQRRSAATCPAEREPAGRPMPGRGAPGARRRLAVRVRSWWPWARRPAAARAEAGPAARPRARPLPRALLRGGLLLGAAVRAGRGPGAPLGRADLHRLRVRIRRGLRHQGRHRHQRPRGRHRDNDAGGPGQRRQAAGRGTGRRVRPR